MKKFFTWLIIPMLLFPFFISGCSNASDTTINEQAATTRTITDAVGREVEIPQTVTSVIPLANALRMMCYADAFDLVAGVELGETEQNIIQLGEL